MEKKIKWGTCEKNSPGYMKRRIKMKNLIKKTDKTEHHWFLLNQVNEHYNEMKSLL